jgi:phage gpG-like protein
MSASLKVDTSGIRRMTAAFDSHGVRSAIAQLPQRKAVAALVGQAVADNFDKQGPGWKPLKIRKGVILSKTGLLRKSATSPGAPGNIYKVEGQSLIWGTDLIYAGIHNKGGVITPKKAKALYIPLTPKGERVGPIKTAMGRRKVATKYGVDFTFAKSVTIPKREFMVIRPQWLVQIQEYIIGQAISIVRDALRRGILG